MANWKKYLILGSICFIIGAIISGVVVGRLVYKECEPTKCPEIEAKEAVKIKVIKGEPKTIKYSKWNFEGPSICFTTTSNGKAEINTAINKLMIPEYNKWVNYKHGIQGAYSGLVFNDGIYRHVFGVSYLHRWEWFALGGGPVISFYEDNEKGKRYGGGFQAFMQFWFK